jgi:hypothetical protein
MSLADTVTSLMVPSVFNIEKVLSKNVLFHLVIAQMFLLLLVPAISISKIGLIANLQYSETRLQSIYILL